MATIRITPEELRTAADFLEARLTAINTEVSSLKSKIDESKQERSKAATLGGNAPTDEKS